MLIFRIDRKACPTDYYHPVRAYFSSEQRARSFAQVHAFTDFKLFSAQTDVYPIVWRLVKEDE